MAFIVVGVVSMGIGIVLGAATACITANKRAKERDEISYRLGYEDGKKANKTVNNGYDL